MGSRHHPQTETAGPKVFARTAQCFGDTISTPQGLGSIMDSLSMGVIVFDRQLHIVIANAQACRIIEPYGLVYKAIQTATAKSAIKDWGKIIKTVLETGKSAQYHAVEVIRSGKEILLDVECTALRDVHSGEIIGGVLILQDVTEKINMQRKLSQAERFAAIGKVAGKVAHELNNPLDGILRYINLALRSIEARQEEKTIQYLDQSKQGLMRMTNIVRELLEFSRSSYLTSVSAPAQKIVDEAVKTISPCAASVKINIIKDDPVAAGAMIDGNLFQVFCNLIKNAFDAMDSEGKLDIIIGSNDKTLSISFADTGPGFEEEIAEEIFKPFFTTKSLGNGTGLGLAICRDIVEKHKGAITAANTDTGCKFTVSLPLEKS